MVIHEYISDKKIENSSNSPIILVDSGKTYIIHEAIQAARSKT